jgi:site-specific recombinase XerD
LNEIAPKFISDFEYYLKTERKCNNNSTVKYLKNFKKIIRIAIANKWLKSDPFANVKFHIEEVDIDFLNEDELNKLMTKKFKIERLQQVRDVYLFCCFTGLAFIDVKELKYSNLEETDGQLWIKAKRHKSSQSYSVPILKPAIEIMNKYKNHPLSIKCGLVLPVMSNQKMNAYIKEIADLCEINKNLTTHTARHTFATTIMLLNGVSLKVVSFMLGHSSIKMTEKYAKVVDELTKKDMENVFTKYNFECITKIDVA